jgi:hypothetical protein
MHNLWLTLGLENSSNAFNSLTHSLSLRSAPVVGILLTALVFPSSVFFSKRTSPKPPRPRYRSIRHTFIRCSRLIFLAGSVIYCISSTRSSYTVALSCQCSRSDVEVIVHTAGIREQAAEDKPTATFEDQDVLKNSSLVVLLCLNPWRFGA